MREKIGGFCLLALILMIIAAAIWGIYLAFTTSFWLGMMPTLAIILAIGVAWGLDWR